MNFWVVSPNVRSNSGEVDAWLKCIKEHQVAFMGWGEDDKLGNVFINRVKPGDIILVAQGANWQKRLFLCGVVKSEAIYGQVPGAPGDAYYRQLKHVVNEQQLNALNLNFDGSAYGVASRIPAIYTFKPSETPRDAEVTQKLKAAILRQAEKEQLVEALNLLRYKHQLVLYGPPGTGKTRRAMQLAEELIKPALRPGPSPKERIKSYLEAFDATQDSVIQARAERQRVREEFLRRFPADTLSSLKLSDYCIGSGDRDNFCWWLERGLASLGKFSPTNSSTYRIYWSKETGEYEVDSKLFPDLTATEAMSKLANALGQAVLNKANSEQSELLRESMWLKIMNAYYPEDYFPINSKGALDNVLKLFGEVPVSDSSWAKNQRVYDLFKSHGSAADANDLTDFLFANFDVRNGRDLSSNNTIESPRGEQHLVQFHPAYSYEDFVRGILAKPTMAGGVSYQVENKILADLAERALEEPNRNFVLIIDELNRANLSAVFGELIYALEYRGKPVQTLYELDGSRQLVLPPNLFLIGTMNTADRSVAHIDYALRRRFAFLPLLPDESVIDDAEGKRLFREVASLFTRTYLAPDFQADEVQPGHSYFLAKSHQLLSLKLKAELQPLLHEYVNDGVLAENARAIIDGLHVA